jgi:hypothetical protein
VGVSVDPIYQTEATYYLNTQVGEDLITNPNAFSVPEEMLLDAELVPGSKGFTLIQASNQVTPDSQLLSSNHLLELRDALNRLHAHFQILYGAQNHADFAIEIEYKIDAQNQFVIKQVRPWASYAPPTIVDTLYNLPGPLLSCYPNPFVRELMIRCDCTDQLDIQVVNQLGQLVHRESIDFRKDYRMLDLPDLGKGIYFITGRSEGGDQYFGGKVMKL